MELYWRFKPVEGPRVVHFRDIVIFRREPKDGYRRNAFFIQLLGKPGRGNSLEDRVRRPAKQTHLLAGDNGDTARVFEQGQIFCARILLEKRLHNGAPAIRWKFNPRCCAGVRFDVERIPIIEPADSIEMVEIVAE